MRTKQLSIAVVLVSSFCSNLALGMPHYTDFNGSRDGYAKTYLDDCGRSCVEDEDGAATCTRVRKEVDDLSPREWGRYLRAFTAALAEPESELQALIDLYTPAFFSRGLHNNGAFLPWHRWYLLQVENVLQEQDCRVTIPYFDWEHEAAIYDHDSYDSLRNRLEHGSGLHDSVHCLVGGTMCSARSSNDPVFFSHHANIDKIWSEWQALSSDNQWAHTGRVGVDRRMPRSTAAPGDVLDMTNLPGGVQIAYDAVSGN